MKNKAKYIVTTILILVLLSGTVISAMAMRPIYKMMGDADLDGTVTIMDATHIQNKLAGFVEFNRLQEVVSDVSENNEVDIIDATIIQKELAELDSGTDKYGLPRNAIIQELYYDIYSEIKEVTYDGEMIKVGTPVTFTAVANTDARFLPVEFEYRIGDTVIRRRSEDPVCTYVFDTPGIYEVDLYAYSTADAWHMTTEVVDVYDENGILPVFDDQSQIN